MKLTDLVQQPYLYEDFYRDFVAPQMGESRRADWDNKSNREYKIPLDTFGTDAAPPDLFSACQQACRSDPKCMQFITWNDGHCNMEYMFKLGVQRVAMPEQFQSGWLTDRIDGWIAENKCTEPNWKPNDD